MDPEVKKSVHKLMEKHKGFVLTWLLPHLEKCKWLIYHCSKEGGGEALKEQIDKLEQRQITNLVKSMFEWHTIKVIDWLLLDIDECRCLIKSFCTMEEEKGSLLLTCIPTVSDSGSASNKGRARGDSNRRFAVEKHPFEDMTPDQEVGCVCLFLLRLPGCVSVTTIAMQVGFNTAEIETILSRSYAVKKFRKKSDTIYYGLRDTDGTADIVFKNMIGDATCIGKIDEIQIRHIPVSQIVPYDEVVPYVEVSDEPMELDDVDRFVI